MIRLLHGDCLEIMQQLIDEGVTVDAVITDPPYGTMGTDGRRKLGINGWDKVIPQAEMLSLCNSLLRVNGCLCLFSQEPYTSELVINAHGNLPFSYRLTWLKNNFANALLVNKAPVNYTEDVCVFFKRHTKHDFKGHHPLREYFKKVMGFIGLSLKQINQRLGHRRAEHTFYIDSTQFGLCTGRTYAELTKEFTLEWMIGFKPFYELKEINKAYRDDLINKMTKEFPKIFNLWEGKKYKSNVLEYKKDYTGMHPTQKPVLLMEDLMKTYTNEGDTVLDFTMGSGSTGIACLNTGRNFIGIERDQHYFQVAKDRIEGHK